VAEKVGCDVNVFVFAIAIDGASFVFDVAELKTSTLSSCAALAMTMSDRALAPTRQPSGLANVGSG
jgi:hypothetical protein